MEQKDLSELPGKVLRLTISIVGWIIVGLAALSFFGSLYGGIAKKTLPGILFVMAIGAGLIFLGNRLKKSAEKKRYAAVVNQQEITNNDELALAVSTANDAALAAFKEMREMFHNDFFTGAHADGANVQIFSAKRVIRVDDSDTIVQDSDLRQVTCGNCGAVVNISADSNGKCEYCGTSIV